MTKLIVDLEIQDPILKQSDWDETEKIKVSVAVTYNYDTDRFNIFGPQDLDLLRALILIANPIIGFNSNKFDLPVIFGMPQRQYPEGIRTYDILAEVWKAVGLDPNTFTPLHKGYSLNSLCLGTLGKSKTGDGASAPLIWRQGNFWKVIDYCLNDVALTKELYDHIDNFGFVRTKNYRGLSETIILDQQKYAFFLSLKGKGE